MQRRDFHKGLLALGIAAPAAVAPGGRAAASAAEASQAAATDCYEESARRLPIRQFDVVVAGGGTAGVVAALAAARRGAKTVLIEAKGYPGGTVTEGGTALHSFYNLWKAFPGVEKRQVVKGIAQEITTSRTKTSSRAGISTTM